MKLAYTHPENGMAQIAIAVDKAAAERMTGGTMSDDNYLAYAVGKLIPQGVKEVLVLADDWTPPCGRQYRNAWRIRDGRVDVCMDTARDIQRDRIRAERAERFAALDVATMKALGAGDAAGVAAVEAQKQKLRDAPAHPSIAVAADPDSLAAIRLDDVI